MKSVASMRPRPFGRGIAFQPPGTTCSPTCFNEAATFRPRNLLQSALRPDTASASMRPRPFGRGIRPRPSGHRMVPRLLQ